MAQLGARFHGMEEVIGSIPIRSTNYFNHLETPLFGDFVASLVSNSKTTSRAGFGAVGCMAAIPAFRMA